MDVMDLMTARQSGGTVTAADVRRSAFVDPLYGANRAEHVAQRFHEVHAKLMPRHIHSKRTMKPTEWEKVPQETKDLLRHVIMVLMEEGTI